MRSTLVFAVLLMLLDPTDCFGGMELETPPGAHNIDPFLVRLEDALARTEKRIGLVFGLHTEGKVVVRSEAGAVDLKLIEERPAGTPKTWALLINSRIARNYSTDDLRIAVARNLYPIVWSKFRKTARNADPLVEQLYVSGMTAYAAELIHPGLPRWKYAGVFGDEGNKTYQDYLSREKGIAAEIRQALSSGRSKELPTPDCGLLSYRLIKTFERHLDPKMIQLMDLAEFRDRLPAGLEVIVKGRN